MAVSSFTDLSVLYMLHDVGKVTPERCAYTIQNITVVTNNTIFIISVNGLELYTRALGKLISRNTLFIQMLIDRQPYHFHTSPYYIFYRIYTYLTIHIFRYILIYVYNTRKDIMQ